MRESRGQGAKHYEKILVGYSTPPGITDAVQERRIQRAQRLREITGLAC
jgi:hypothetical protein